jgi:hypothetical protein
MDSKDLINWGELSRRITGSRDAIRRNRIPKRHEAIVNRLLKLLDCWTKWIEKN